MPIFDIMKSDGIGKGLKQRGSGFAYSEALKNISERIFQDLQGPDGSLGALMDKLARERDMWRSSMEDVIKRVQMPTRYHDPFKELRGFESLTLKLASQQSEFQSPLSEFMEQMERLQNSRMGMFKSLENIQSIALRDSFSQIRNLQHAFDTSSLRFVNEVIAVNRVDILKDLNEIAIRVVGLNEKVIQEDPIQQGLDELKAAVFQATEKIDKIGKDLLSRIIILINIVTAIWMIYTEVKKYISDSDPVTKMEVREIVRKLNEDLLTRFGKYTTSGNTLTVSRSCNLRVKPNTRSYVILVLEPETSVSIMYVKGKWAYVALVNDDFTFTHGWVYKKYLYK